MIILTSNGLSSDKLINHAKVYIHGGKAALVVTADNEYKEKNYHVERLSGELVSLGLTVECFDFDYNFIIPHPGTGYSWKGEVIKDQFMEALKLALRGTKYSVCENSTSVITIKVVDRKKSKIEHSCDFAIIYYPKNEIFDGYYYLKRLKSLNCYCFEKRSVASRVDEKLEYILKYDNGWNRIKEEYLKLKNSNNDPDKHSFALYLEAVNNVYNQLKPSYSLGFIRLN